MGRIRVLAHEDDDESRRRGGGGSPQRRILSVLFLLLLLPHTASLLLPLSTMFWNFNFSLNYIGRLDLRGVLIVRFVSNTVIQRFEFIEALCFAVFSPFDRLWIKNLSERPLKCAWFRYLPIVSRHVHRLVVTLIAEFWKGEKEAYFDFVPKLSFFFFFCTKGTKIR